jgi:hypothetical protein
LKSKMICWLICSESWKSFSSSPIHWSSKSAGQTAVFCNLIRYDRHLFKADPDC